MKKLDEKNIRLLRQQKKVTDLNNNRLKPFIQGTSKPAISIEEKQVVALENVASEISKVSRISNANAIILIEMIRKIKIDFPKFSEPVKKWSVVPIRGENGLIEKITVEAQP